MLKKLKDSLESDRTNLWIAVCETENPGFWGFVIGYSAIATTLYTIMCAIIIIANKIVQKET